ncbi:MAG TPA: hypothetical protein PKA64_22930, partial [Myxococcota bacterium]|nr:hypothetical protein [Myxococcota bacterium]
ATCATASAPDDGCVADEDCPSGSCVDHACAAGLSPALCMDDAEPPSNGGYDAVLVRDDVPEALRVTAHSSSNSGTTDSITLVLRNSEASYACTISGGVATGASAECVPSKSSSSTDYGDVFYVKYTDKSSAAGSDDGLRMTSFAVKYDGTWYTTQTFDIALSTKIDCEGCFLASDCNSCWLDGDDHNKCLEIKSDAMLEGDGTVQCIDHN